MTKRPYTDVEFEVLEDRYPWRIRFWPAVIYWAAVVGIIGAAMHNIPNAPEGYVPLYVLGAALISPAVRFIWSALSSSARPVDELSAQLLRQRLLRDAEAERAQQL